ncbi:hypothetical protein MMC21_001680 [Puttea exsequens]|nr:hypothetical protein [Puttea exsequens]
MNQCLRIVAPKFFLLIEARYGQSTLQNFDAIIRNTVLGSRTNPLWRLNLGIYIALPIVLSFVYKAGFFKSGLGTVAISNPTNISHPYYGLAAPPGVQRTAYAVGLSYMANASTTWYAATSILNESTDLPDRPTAYGINTLFLSNISVAMLDTPMPDYISALQWTLGKRDYNDSHIISARNITGTVTTYNDTAETLRHDPAFWVPYQGAYNGDASTETGPYGQNIGLLANNYNKDNASWCFVGFYPIANFSTPKNKFRANALGFNTRREVCNATWSLSREKMQLIGGSCQSQSLDASKQALFTQNSFMFTWLYPPILREYLGRFAKPYSNISWLHPTPSSRWDPWIVPSFTTVVASMYWSRAVARYSYASWDSIDKGDEEFLLDKTDVYYPVSDQIQYQIPILSHFWLLFLILAIQPFLTLLIFLLGLINYATPIDKDFGMVSILAGVRPSSLALLKGASISGVLKRPLPVNIIPARPIQTADHKEFPDIEYVLGENGARGRKELLHNPVMVALSDIRGWLQGKRKSSNVYSKGPIELQGWRRTDTMYGRLK